MPVITLDGGQSETAVNGESATYFARKAVLECPGAPDTLIESKLADVLSSFYQDSLSWRKVVGPYKIIAGRDQVHVNPVDQYTEARYVLGAYIWDGTSNAKQYLRPSPRLLVGGDVGQPCSFFMLEPDIMQLYPMPNVTLGPQLYVYAALEPNILTPQLPSISTTHHFDAIMAGLLSRLMMMGNKPWTDKDMAMRYEKDYKRGVLRYRDEANRGYSTAEAPFRFPSFANNRG